MPADENHLDSHFHIEIDITMRYVCRMVMNDAMAV